MVRSRLGGKPPRGIIEENARVPSLRRYLRMSSQKSSAVPPQRARGRARVEALLEAASLVFSERGYDQATMTEIATRSNTAIGSLYRFFPTKEALGEMLLRRFLERAEAGLDELTARASELPGDALAEALVRHVTGAGDDSLRVGTQAILEGRSDAREIRRTFRVRRRKQLAAILRRANPDLSQERAYDRAAVLLYILKGEEALVQDEPSAARRLGAELRRVAVRYVEDALGERGRRAYAVAEGRRRREPRG
jgi:AcrR family transcriptional regulator